MCIVVIITKKLHLGCETWLMKLLITIFVPNSSHQKFYYCNHNHWSPTLYYYTKLLHWIIHIHEKIRLLSINIHLVSFYARTSTLPFARINVTTPHMQNKTSATKEEEVGKESLFCTLYKLIFIYFSWGNFPAHIHMPVFEILWKPKSL